MKPMKRLSFLLLIVVVNLSVARAVQNPGFDATRLSPKGRVAYQKLLSAGVFSVGGLGYAGATSEQKQCSMTCSRKEITSNRYKAWFVTRPLRGACIVCLD